MTQLESNAPTTERPPSPRLRRSTDDKVVAGVCGGLGRYFDVDPLFFRLAFVVLTIGGGSGILLYLIGWLVIPEQGKDEAVVSGAGSLGTQGPVLAGAALIAVGAMLLMNNLVPWFDKVMLPMVVIAAGAALLYTGGRRDRT
jgi:phage shock protein PspC (stress-responsive transcriptional regulator)